MAKKKKLTPTTLPWKEILSFLGIIVGAYLTFKGIQYQIDAPIRATQTAEARFIQSALTGTLTPSPIVSPTGIPTREPTDATATPILDIEQNCLSANWWIPYEGAALKTNEFNCWIINEWGIAASNGGILIAPATDKDKSHGIYRAIPNHSKISFQIRLDKFSTIYDLEPGIMIGIVSLSHPNPTEGKYLVLQRETTNDDSIYVKLRESTKESDRYLPFRFTEGETHTITFVIQDIVMTIYIDNEKLDQTVSVPFSEKAFWVGYNVSALTTAQAFLSELSIEEMP